MKLPVGAGPSSGPAQHICNGLNDLGTCLIYLYQHQWDITVAECTWALDTGHRQRHMSKQRAHRQEQCPWPPSLSLSSHGAMSSWSTTMFHPWLDRTGHFLSRALYAQVDLLVAQAVKNLPTVREAWVQSLGQEDSGRRGTCEPWHWYSTLMQDGFPWGAFLGLWHRAHGFIRGLLVGAVAVVRSSSRVRLFGSPWASGRQASLSLTCDVLVLCTAQATRKLGTCPLLWGPSDKQRSHLC